MRVRMTKQARADVMAALSWWRGNRNKAPELLLEELRAARATLAATPLVGVAVPDEAVPTLRRLVLTKTRYFAFYRVDAVREEVVVLRLWHHTRGQRPRL